MSSLPNLNNFTKIIGIKFRSAKLLEQAFIHRSYLNEHPDFKLGHNERLEFLGDAVLELTVTEYLYENFPNHPEGELTNLRSSIVRGAMLAQVAKDFKMGDYIRCSKGEEKSGGKAKELILANTFESLVGAIYLDQGYDLAKKFVERVLLVHLKEIISKGLYRDPKSSLQEWSQEVKGVTPNYKVIEESGPDHNKSFLVGVYLGDRLLSKGKGASKQKAQEQAAQLALEKVRLQR